MSDRKGINQERLEKELDKYGKKVSGERLDEAEKTAEKFRTDSRISHLWDRIKMMFVIAKNPKVWGVQVAIWIGAALLYLISPIDIIPDIVPALGLTDDIAAILAVLNRVSSAISTKIQSNPAYYLQLFPEALRPVVVSEFNLDSVSVVSHTGAVAESGEDTLLKQAGKKVKFVIMYGGILGGSRFVKFLGNVQEKQRLKGKTGSLRYRIAGFFLKRTELEINRYVDKKFKESIQTSIDFVVEKKMTKSLLSSIIFMLALATYSLTAYGAAWVYISAFLMLVSYSFIVVAIIKILREIVIFVAKGIRIKRENPSFSLLDGCVCAVAFDMFRIERELTKLALDEMKSNDELKRMGLRVVFRLFNGEIGRGILHFILLSLVFFLMKQIASSLSYGMSPLQIILGPIMMAFERLFG